MFYYVNTYNDILMPQECLYSKERFPRGEVLDDVIDRYCIWYMSTALNLLGYICKQNSNYHTEACLVIINIHKTIYSTLDYFIILSVTPLLIECANIVNFHLKSILNRIGTPELNIK